MQVTLNIPINESTPSLEDILKELTQEDRKEIATKVYREWLTSKLPVERKMREKEVIRELLDKKDFNGNPKYKDEESARDSYYFRNKMKDYKSSKDRLIEEIMSEMKKNITSYVTEVIKEHPQKVKIQNDIETAIQNEFPAMVLKMFALYLVSEYSNQAQKNFNEILRIDNEILNITDKLSVYG